MVLLLLYRVDRVRQNDDPETAPDSESSKIVTDLRK